MTRPTRRLLYVFGKQTPGPGALTPTPRPQITNPWLLCNRYKPRKVWPPDLAKMTPQQQLRIEKKYKRRVNLAHSCTDLKRWVGLAQFGSITAVIFWVLLFARFDDDFIPFYPLRKEIYSWFGVDIGPQLSGKTTQGGGLPGFTTKEDVWKKDR